MDKEIKKFKFNERDEDLEMIELIKILLEYTGSVNLYRESTTEMAIDAFIQTAKKLEETIKDLEKIKLKYFKESKTLPQETIDMLVSMGVNYTENEITEKNDKTLHKLNDSIAPEKYIMPNNKMMNKLSSGKIPDGTIGLEVMTSPRVITQITTKYEDANIQMFGGKKRYTPYDRPIYNAICSLWEAGNRYFTPNQLYRCMNGLTNGEYVTPQRIGAITKSIDKVKTIYAVIDYTEEYKAYQRKVNKNADIPEDTEFIMEDYLLSVTKMKLQSGGKEVTGYRINSEPLLYEYAKISGQIITTPIELLNSQGILNTTPEVTVLKEYLIRRIEVMKNQRGTKQSNRITFNSIYEELNLKNPDKNKKRSIRNHTKTLLDNYKDTKYIKNYELYKKGRAYHGVKISY